MQKCTESILSVFFNLKKEGNSDTCYKFFDIMLSELSQSQKDKY